MTRILFDFSDASAADGWTAIDDRVMGGMSRSRLRSDLAGHAVFEGVVSLAQGGGFASVRSPTGDFGLPGAQACIVEARGIGSHFKLSLFTDGGFDAASHQAEFAPAGPDWQTLRLPLADFSATFRGRVIPGADPLDPARIRQIGLVIARRQAGSFSLDLRKISLD